MLLLTSRSLRQLRQVSRPSCRSPQGVPARWLHQQHVKVGDPPGEGGSLRPAAPQHQQCRDGVITGSQCPPEQRVREKHPGAPLALGTGTSPPNGQEVEAQERANTSHPSPRVNLAVGGGEEATPTSAEVEKARAGEQASSAHGACWAGSPSNVLVACGSTRRSVAHNQRALKCAQRLLPNKMLAVPSAVPHSEWVQRLCQPVTPCPHTAALAAMPQPGRSQGVLPQVTDTCTMRCRTAGRHSALRATKTRGNLTGT